MPSHTRSERRKRKMNDSPRTRKLKEDIKKIRAKGRQRPLGSRRRR